MFKFRFNPHTFKSIFNIKNLFFAAIPVLHVVSNREPYQCWFFGKSYTRNKLTNRVQTIQYNANAPIEDRISYRDLFHIDGYAALVLDGHGGWQVAEFANKRLIDALDDSIRANRFQYSNQDELIYESIKDAFNQVENEMLSFAKSVYSFGVPEICKIGACALLVVVVGNKVYSANAGDSQGLLISEDKGKYQFQKLNKKLNANSKKEQKRLKETFPDETDIVVCKRPDQTVCYVKGRLQPTRSFGDFRLKYKDFNTLPAKQSLAGYKQGPYITHQPEIRMFNLQKKHKYIVLGCDGLWDQLSKGEVTYVVKNNYGDSIPKQLLAESLKRAAKSKRMTVDEMKKVEQGKRRKLHDDISIIGIRLEQQFK